MERQFIERHPPAVDPEKDYDIILDILIRSIQDNYGDDEYNFALDMAKLHADHGESEFERLMREKHQREALIKERINQKIYEQQRAMRTTMNLQKLLETQVTIPAREYEMKQREMLKKFVESRGHNDSHGDGFMEVLK